MPIVDENGYPIPEGVGVDEFGYPSGSVSSKARGNLERLRKNTPGEGPGAMRRFLQGFGVPTSAEEFANAITHVNPVQNFAENPSMETAMGALAPPLAAGGRAAGDLMSGNVAGGLGGATNVAMQFAPGLMKSRPKPTGRPAVQHTIPITVEDTPSVLARAGRAAYELLPIPAPIKAVRELLGKPRKSGTRTEYVPFEETPDPPASAPPPVQATGTNFPLDRGILLDPVPRPGGSPPVTPEFIVQQLMDQPKLPDMWQGPTPATGAAFGDAPVQTPAGPQLRMGRANQGRALKQMNTPGSVASRMEYGDQGSRMTQGITPPLSPAELQGARSQIGQVEGAVDTSLNTGTAMPTAGFSPQMMQYLLGVLEQRMPKGKP